MTRVEVAPYADCRLHTLCCGDVSWTRQATYRVMDSSLAWNEAYKMDLTFRSLRLL